MALLSAIRSPHPFFTKIPFKNVIFGKARRKVKVLLLALIRFFAREIKLRHCIGAITAMVRCLNMKTCQRLFIFALLALAVTALLSPWAAPHGYALLPVGMASSAVLFSRIFDRVFMIAGWPWLSENVILVRIVRPPKRK
jgi:hypothetical protein